MANYNPIGSGQPLNGLVAIAQTNATISTSSSVVLSADPDIRTVAISNIGLKDAFFKLGTTAVVGEGITIEKGEDSTFDFPNGLTGDIEGITAAASTDLTIEAVGEA